MGTHSLLAPSAAHRWLHCTGSVPLTADMPEETSSYAKEGTWAHRLAELRLTGVADFSDDERQKAEADGVDVASLNEPVNFYVNFVQSLGGRLFVEQRLQLEAITHEKGSRGTSDAVVITDNELTICDLKYGMGDKIEAEENPQLTIYAAAAYNAFAPMFDIEKVTMVIVQPRLNHVSQWTITADELQTRVNEISAVAQKCLDACGHDFPQWEFTPGVKACKYCKARFTCRALASFSLTAAGVDFLDKSKKPMLDGAELGQILGKIDLIEKWCGLIRDAGLNELLAGRELPGYKLVMGREGVRKWTDDKDAEKRLKGFKIGADDRYTKKLISPTQAEKLVKAQKLTPEQWAELNGLVTREPAKPTLATENDKRPAYHVLNVNDYPDETEQHTEEEFNYGIKTGPNGEL